MGVGAFSAIVIIVLLLNCFIVQWFYHLFIYSRLAFYKTHKGKAIDSDVPVTVIISARNEYVNLEKNLPLILEQDYPDFEVIVINDCSWDQTGTLLDRLRTQYPRLQVVTIHEQEKYPTGKKFALTLGIKAAQHEWLVFTDADCKPVGRHWLRLMASNCHANKELILGYSPYSRQSGFLNLFIRYETLMTAMSYFSFALMNDAYMGVGRNMAYRRSLFFSVKGFAAHNHLISGDDDLFVNETSNSTNVAIELRKDSFMVSEPKKTHLEWKKQKRRHLSTGQYYKSRHKFWLGLYSVSHILFYLLMFASLIFIPLYSEATQQYNLPESAYYILAIPVVYLLRLLTQYAIYIPIARKLSVTSVLIALPLLDFVYFIYLLIYGTASLFTKPKTWN